MVDSVPMKDRYLNMGSTVRKYVSIIADIKAKDAKLAAEQLHLFLYLVEPWLSVVDEGTIPKTLVAQRKKLASDVGFNGEQARTDLETILARG